MILSDLRPALVVDASVGIKWFLEEEHGFLADRLIAGNRYRLNVPDLFLAEMGNILWKRCRIGEIETRKAKKILTELGKYSIKVWPIQHYALSAVDLAAATGRTYYDCLYLALGMAIDAPFVTADKKFWNSLKDTPLAKHVCWIEDMDKLG